MCQNCDTHDTQLEIMSHFGKFQLLMAKAWNEIPKDLFATLVDAQPRVMEAIIAADGGKTKY